MRWSESLGQVMQARSVLAYGSTLRFAYAPGQGTLVILAGTFTALINNFLQSGGAKASAVLQQVAGGLIFFAGCYILFQGIRNLLKAGPPGSIIRPSVKGGGSWVSRRSCNSSKSGKKAGVAGMNLSFSSSNRCSCFTP